MERKYIQNQHRPIDDLDIQGLTKVTLLIRGKQAVEHYQFGLGFLDEILQLIDNTSADKIGPVGPLAFLQETPSFDSAGSIGQAAQFI